jgi:hypothetical protein
VQLEEQQPPATLVWSYLVRIINGGLTLDNWLGKVTEGTTPFVVPNFFRGGICLNQDGSATVYFSHHVDGVYVGSTPPGKYVTVFVF